jgi:hypothetical protein
MHKSDKKHTKSAKAGLWPPAVDGKGGLDGQAVVKGQIASEYPERQPRGAQGMGLKPIP